MSPLWDHIVIGAGPVGCVVTDALVDAARRVRPLGAGPRVPGHEGRVRAPSDVSAADASVMPDAGDRHPTLTLLANASRNSPSIASFAARFSCRRPPRPDPVTFEVMSMSLRAAHLLVPALALALVGCGADSVGSDGASTRAPIISGTISGPEDDAAIWLGILSPDGYLQGSCSGTLIADNLVLTARHCTASTQEGGIACSKAGAPVSGGKVIKNYDATNFAVIVGARMKQKADAFGTVLVDNGAGNLCDNDIALVVLDRHIPNATIAPIRLDAPPVKGKTMRAVGWGVTNKGGGGMTSRRMRRTGVPIAAVGPAIHNGAVGPNEFGIGEAICSGDSGGPAFDETTNAVIGVVSRGGNGAPYDPNSDPEWTQCVDQAGYETSNLYTRTDSFRDLILSAFEQAGSEPWVEGGPDPRKAKAGASCDGPDACRSALCLEVSGANVCADACDTAGATCGVGFECRDVGTTKACLAAPSLTSDGATVAGGGCSVGAESSAHGGVVAAVLGLLAMSTLGSRAGRRARAAE